MKLKLTTGKIITCDKVRNIEITPMHFYQHLDMARRDSKNGHCDYGRHYLPALTLAIGLENVETFEVFIEYTISGEYNTVFDICFDCVHPHEYFKEHVHDRTGFICLEDEYEI